MIIIIIVIAVGSLVIRYLPILLVEFVATIIAVWQTIAANRIGRELANRGSRAECGGSDINRKPTAADRRLLKRALRAAMRQTQTTSLFPHIALRADIIATSVSHWMD